ncbi:hypothetical protein DPMN_179412 [Dreissena polymorpha]|uniref:Uncharacterized protein n=1 Tax=Dreissena polymorpha TaxID=45954 RepID=A0A9D4EDY3_DREPO|nr:hypothetical protein DPMN_179412 [Dreissena polymorpha]
MPDFLSTWPLKHNFHLFVSPPNEGDLALIAPTIHHTLTIFFHLHKCFQRPWHQDAYSVGRPVYPYTFQDLCPERLLICGPFVAVFHEIIYRVMEAAALLVNRSEEIPERLLYWSQVAVVR